ncbi:TPA: bifunctional Cof-type HAD-IIB family hydrolase/peptidylprolyl isomerase [Streptococcus pneumoniae]|nr:bifunctional Cof-type HAD-IIB family hydrolase/peptidylprolyl isomerase [Streptococcus pneumoniae]
MDAKLRYKAKKIKIVFFDIDDTLRNSKTGFIPTTIPTVFKQLREKGILTGIASGRGIFGVVPEIRDLKPDFFVTLNGAYIEDKKGQVIYQHQIEKSDVEEYISWAKQEGIEYGLVGSHDAKLSTRTDMMSEAINPIYPDLDVDPDFHEKEDIYQMWTFEDKGDDLHLPDSLSDKLRMVRWHQHSSDIVPISGSKATGVEKVVEHLGLKPEKVMVFGDGLNDLELFDYAGISVAMGISHDKIKEKADYITKTLEEDGIFAALEVFGMVEKELHFPQVDIETVEGPLATIKTNHGDLRIKLFPEHAPKTVANFVSLSKDGYYDGVIFHRIIKDFMIQGGDPTGTGMGGESIYGESFEDEFSEELYNIRGALSMANAGPNTNGSQFFIVQNQHLPYSKKENTRGGWPEPIAEIYANQGGTPHLDRRHTVFGQLADEASYAVLDAIAAVETGAMDKPVEDVVIETIEIED